MKKRMHNFLIEKFVISIMALCVERNRKNRYINYNNLACVPCFLQNQTDKKMRRELSL
jgi:hypothetical protein